MSSTGQMPPFPGLDESTVGRTPGEDEALRNQMALYGGLPSNQPGGVKFQDSYISNRLGELHKMHTDSAKRHYSNIQNYYYTLDDPQGNLSDEQRQSYQNQLNGAWDDLLKTPGLDKDAKAELQARREAMDQVLTHGRAKVAHTMMGMMPAPPDQQATTQTAPSPTDVPAGAATSPTPASMTPPADYEAQSWGQSASMAPPPGMVPPNSDATPASMAPPVSAGAGASPAPSSASGTGNMPPLPQVLPGEMLGPSVQAGMATDIATSNRIRERAAVLKAAGVEPGSEEYKYAMVNNSGNLPTMGTAKTYVRPDGSTFNGRTIGMTVYNEYGEVEQGAKPATAAEQGGRSIYMVDGMPAGVKRGGEELTPHSKKWNAEDQQFLADNLDTWKSSEAGKDHRVKLAADARARSFAALRPIGVIDTLTNSLVEITADMLADHPGRYAPAAQGVQMNNRKVLFDEINTATDLLNQSIAGLGDEAFDAGSRAQMAAIMSKEDPGVMKDAFNTFLRGDIAKNLTEPQIQYVTALENMQESALALRAVGGLGTGAQDVRKAITDLLPSASTPTKAYAQRQMQLFQTEVSKLQQSILRLGNPPAGGGGGLTPPGGAATPQKRAAPKVGEIVNGHRYKGGPFNSPSSWEAVAPATPGAK